jgi:hypothetical protein
VGIKRHRLANGLTTDLLVAVARPETSPVSGGGAAAATGNPARFRVERVNMLWCELLGVLGGASEVWFGAVRERSGEFAGSGNGGCDGARCSREEGRATTFYRCG